MDKPEKLAILCMQDTRRRQTKQKTNNEVIQNASRFYVQYIATKNVTVIILVLTGTRGNWKGIFIKNGN
jgi:hypothetical protein